jgi:chromosomal replication initiator protein
MDETENVGQSPTISQISSVVAKQFHLQQAVLKGASRRATAVLARGLAMLAARRYCRLSYQEIGRHFGRRDHTTVLHACHKLENLLKTDQLVAAAWRQILLNLNVECGEL